MHVLTLTPFYPTARDDASGCFIAESVRELHSLGIESSVVAVHPAYRSHPGLDPKAPPAIVKKYFGLPGNSGLSSAGWFLYEALKSLVRRVHSQAGVDLIHAHGPLPCGHAAMLLSRELGVPYVITVHGLDAFSTRQVPGWFGRRCAEVCRELYAKAGKVICISEKVAQPIREEMRGAAQIAIVYNGADPALFFAEGDRQLPDPVILSVGNLIPTKGHDSLLKAVASIAKSHPRVECKIIGDGPERGRLQGLARNLRIEDRVHFLGRKSRTEVARAMRECTIFALPSWYEGLGCVYLEAMSAERPAIGCHGQGIEEIIRHGENGWLVQPKNVDDLAAALEALLSDSTLRERIGCAGRQTILHGFTLKHQAERMLSIYRTSVR